MHNVRRVLKEWKEIILKSSAVLARLKEKNYLLQDLEIQLLYDTAAAIKDYKKSPQWLKSFAPGFFKWHTLLSSTNILK
jgi:hypothetical protein